MPRSATVLFPSCDLWRRDGAGHVIIFLAHLTVLMAPIITRWCPCHPVREPGDLLSEQSIPLPPSEPCQDRLKSALRLRINNNDSKKTERAPPHPTKGIHTHCLSGHFCRSKRQRAETEALRGYGACQGHLTGPRARDLRLAPFPLHPPQTLSRGGSMPGPRSHC